MKRSRRKKKTNKDFEVVRKSITKILAILVIVALNWTGLSAVLETFAYYNDTETANDNMFSAALLDFSITNRYIENFIGMEALSEIEFASVVTKKTGSLNIQYEVNAEKISGNDDFCNALKMEVERNGVEKHDGSLLSFSASATTELGTWEFELDLPASATNVPHGAECNVDLVFKGWRADVVTFEESGFTDEERIELRLTSRMIVLNEFLPRPDGWAYGFDFGDDNSDMPRGEWVELYNNSDYNFDLAGWYIRDESPTNKVMITAANTYPAGTVINGKSWLVVYMNKAVLDNTGDTVKLFDSTDRLIDSYGYTSHDYCELEPTPGDENSDTTGSGSCGLVPSNKSYARIPDGIGYWVDPIPTPGGPNVLELAVPEPEIVDSSESTVSDTETVSEETTIIIDGLFVGSSVVDIQTEEEIEVEEIAVEEDKIVEEEQEGEQSIAEEEIITGEQQSGEEEPIIEEQPTAEEETIIEEEPVVEEEQVIEEQPVIEEQTVIVSENTSEDQALPQTDDGGGDGDGGAPIESGDSGESTSE